MTVSEAMHHGLAARVGSRNLILAGVCLAAFAAFSVFIDYFFDSYNLLNMTKYGVEIGLIALAEMLVISGGGGGIDLSVGSQISFLSAVTGMFLVSWELSLPVALAGVLVLAVLIGLANGLLVAYLRIPALIATLATMYALNSLALVMTNTRPISGFGAEFYAIGQGTVLGVPNQVLLVFVPLVVTVHLAVTRTAWGRRVLLVGSNERAASLVGIRVRRVRLSLYVASAVLSAVAALVMTSRVASGRPDAGLGYELQAITVAVLGGTEMAGGRASPGGVVLAILLITMLTNALNLAGVQADWRIGILGLILFGTVVLNRFFSGDRARSR